MSAPRVLITGANRGLGLATARELLRRGCTVTVTARSEAKLAATLAALREQGEARVRGEVLELSSFADIRRFAAGERERARDTGERFDLVHHNAGVLVCPKQRTLSADGHELVLQVNCLAPLLLTIELLEVLARPAHVTAAGSSLHMPGSRGDPVDFRFEDPMLEQGYSDERAYKNSKLALLWVMGALDRRLRARKVRCDVICPGFVPETAAASFRGVQRFMLRHVLTRMPFATSLESSATHMAELLCELALADEGGRYFSGWREVPPSEDARDLEQSERFWTLAAALTKHALAGE